MNKLSLDILNYHLLLRHPMAKKVLEITTCEIRDAFNNVVFSNQGTTELTSTLAIEHSSQKIFHITTLPKDANILQDYLNLAISEYLKNNDIENKLEHNQNLQIFLGHIFQEAQKEDCHLRFLFYLLLSKLRSFILVRRCSVFNLAEGHLEGILGVAPEATYLFEDRKFQPLDLNTVAGFVATNGLEYISNDPGSDQQYKKSTNYAAPQNLACFPLIADNKVHGVLNLSGQLTEGFNSNVRLIISQFLPIFTHLLVAHRQQEQHRKHHGDTQTLSQYISANLAQNIMSQDANEDVHGIQKKIICLFCDIRSFTTISEKLTPEKLVSLLNIYFENLNAAIVQYKGTIDKLVGDMISAIWNAPIDLPDAEFHAVKAALEMQKKMIHNVVPHWNGGGVPRVGIGIGLHLGEAVVGNIGGNKCMNYTSIGETLEIGEKLESMARPGEVLISESLMSKVKGRVPVPLKVYKNHDVCGQKMNIYVLKPIEYPDY